MQENIVITGGKETRTYGIDAKTGLIFNIIMLDDSLATF